MLCLLPGGKAPEQGRSGPRQPFPAKMSRLTERGDYQGAPNVLEGGGRRRGSSNLPDRINLYFKLPQTSAVADFATTMAAITTAAIRTLDSSAAAPVIFLLRRTRGPRLDANTGAPLGRIPGPLKFKRRRRSSDESRTAILRRDAQDYLEIGIGVERAGYRLSAFNAAQMHGILHRHLKNQSLDADCGSLGWWFEWT
jgi:hypothetical protein